MKLLPISLPNEGNGSSVLNTYGTSVEFKRRMDAYGTAYGVVINGSGYRTIEAQAQAWIDYKNDPANHNLAAYPGQSWHNCGLAYDVRKDDTGHYPASMESDYHLPIEQQAMYQFGLCIPMWENGAPGQEPWHVVPVECIGVAESQRQKFLDEDDLLDTPSGYRTLKVIRIDGWPTDKPLYMIGSDVKRCQRAMNLLKQDGYYGVDTENAVKEMQAASGLTVDGICGTKSWAVISKILNPVPPEPPVDYKALYEEQLQINAELQAQLDAEKAKSQQLAKDLNDMTNKYNDVLADITAIDGAYASMDNAENQIIMAEQTVANIIDKY